VVCLAYSVLTPAHRFCVRDCIYNGFVVNMAVSGPHQ
jgi:hypothetical protein